MTKADLIDRPRVEITQAPRELQRKVGRCYRTIRVSRHVYLRMKHRITV